MSRRAMLISGGALGFAILVGLAVFIFRNDSPSPNTIKIAVNLPYEIDIGEQMFTAITLALDTFDGQVKGIPVELVKVDYILDQDFDNNAGAAQEISKNPDIIAVIGAINTNHAQQTIPIYNEAGIALISPAATWPGLTQIGYRPGEPGIYYPTGKRNFFRVIPGDDLQGLAAARWFDDQNLRDIYVLSITNNTYSQGLVGILESYAPTYALNIVGTTDFNSEAITSEERDLLASQILATKPDAIYFPMPTNILGYQIIETLHRQQPDIVIVSSDGLANETFQADVDNTLLEDVYATIFQLSVDDLQNQSGFIEQFEAIHQTQPTTFVFTAYDSMLALLFALEQAKPMNREGVLDALASIETFHGLTGTWTFDQNGNTTLSTFVMLQFVDGEWTHSELLR